MQFMSYLHPNNIRFYENTCIWAMIIRIKNFTFIFFSGNNVNIVLGFVDQNACNNQITMNSVGKSIQNILSAIRNKGDEMEYSSYGNNWLRIGFSALMCCETKNVMRKLHAENATVASYKKFLHDISIAFSPVDDYISKNHIIVLHATIEQYETYLKQPSPTASVKGASLQQTYLEGGTDELTTQIFSASNGL